MTANIIDSPAGTEEAAEETARSTMAKNDIDGSTPGSPTSTISGSTRQQGCGGILVERAMGGTLESKSNLSLVAGCIYRIQWNILACMKLCTKNMKNSHSYLSL